MKKIFVILVALIGFGINAFGQITVRESNRTAVDEKTSKQIAFDSMTNIIVLSSREPVTNYKKYIGKTLYFLPKAQNYKSAGEPINYLFTKKSSMVTPKGGGHLEERSTELYKACGKQKLETCPDSVENRYFTILDIEGRLMMVHSSTQKFRSLEDWPYDFHPYELEFTLKNESNGEILFWRVGTNGRTNSLKLDNLNSNSKQPFLLVSYFEKQKSMCQNQNFVVREKMRNIIDINTGKIVGLEKGEIWHCYDVSLFDSDVSPFLAGFYFLRNGDREIKFRLGSEDIKTFFMTETEFRQIEDEKRRIADEQEQRKEEARLKKEEEEKQRIEREKSDIDRILNLQTRPDSRNGYCIQTIYNKLNTSSLYFQGFLQNEIGLTEHGEPDYNLKNGIGTIKTTYINKIIMGNVDYNAYKVNVQYSVFPIEDDLFVEKLDIWGNWESVAKIFILYYPASLNIEYLKNNKTEVTSYYIGDRASFTSEMVGGRLIGRIKVGCRAERNRKTFLNEYELKKREFNAN